MKATDVSGTNRTRECRCKCLKVGSITFVTFAVKLTPHNTEGMTQVTKLWKLKIDRKEDTSTQQQPRKPGAATKITIYPVKNTL